MALNFKGLGQALNPFNKSIQTAGPAGFGAAPGSVMNNVYPVQVRRLKQDVQKWREALDKAENVYYPNRTQLLNIYADVVLDPHLTSVLTTRKINVLGKGYKVVDADGTEDVKLTKLLTRLWFRQLCDHAIESKFYGHSLVEFMPPVDGEFHQVSLIPRQYVFPEAHLVRSMPSMIVGVDYEEDPQYAPWILEIGERHDFGLLLKASPVVIWKKTVMGAWASFTEMFGMPYRAVSGAMDGPQMEQVNEMMAAMGQAGYGVFPEGVTLDFIAPSTGNALLYDKFLERSNSELSKLVMGQTMTTDSGSSRSQGEVHERVADQYTKDDAVWLADWINETLFPFLLLHGYPMAGYSFAFDDTESLSKAEQFLIVSGIMKDSGFRVTQKYLEDTFGVELEEMPAPPPIPPGKPVGQPSPTQPASLLPGQLPQPVAGLNLQLVTAAAKSKLDKLAEAVIKRVHAGDLFAGTIDAPLYGYLRKHLESAVSIGWDATDPKLRGHLSKNIQRFSGFKTHAVQQAMQEKLTDSDGKVRPFAEFRADALQVSQLYNVDYLETEYNTAIASAQMASRWTEFSEGAMLSYRTVGDGLVRPEHAEYDGVTLPKDDPFWDSFYPPCDYNCRCEVVETDADATPTGQDTVDSLPEPPEEFRNNSGKGGEVFNAEHPYFDVAEAVAAKIEEQL